MKKRGSREIIRRMRMMSGLGILALAVAPLGYSTASQQGPREQHEQPEFIQQGRQLMLEGKLPEALTLYQQTLQSSPDSRPANLAAGSVLDLMGKGEEARKYFQKAIDTADTGEHKAMAERAVAMSYAFEGNCGKTIEYEQRVFDYFAGVKNFYQQGEIADEAARVCLDASGLNGRAPRDDIGAAQGWYEMGHSVGLREPDIKPARVDLWNFRWESAQARIATRQGDRTQAEKHAAAAKAILERGTNPEQAPFLPYLLGYVAFYGGEYKTALDELLKANQNDPFVQCLLGQTYEKLGEKEKAMEYYRKAAGAISHNPPAAYAVPYSKSRLSALGAG
ncbi:MAG TPA: tetratricopeptide repeat protein [Candidatus Sulfotelmatobacter sp.]|nr:tetratricopeptide repeat protein [Candidatus Sulfotelmatobacter sp.]